MGSNATSLKFARGTVETGRGRLHATVNREDALMYVGYRGQAMDEHLAQRFEKLAAACETAHEVSYAWRIDTLGANDQGDPLMEGCGLVLPGADIARHLQGACLVATFACTLGQGSQRELARYSALNPLDGMLYDCCASSLAEEGAHAVQRIIADKARDLGLWAHARFSPGYGDLPLSIQPAFLTALGADRALGMSTTSSNMLLPTKSVTAILGLFAGEDDDAPSPCSLCAAAEYCCYRERGTTCHGK